MSLISVVRDDIVYVKFKKILEVTMTKVNIEADTSEALALHASRTSRRLNGEDRYSAKKLIDANLKDLACRARLVELRVKNDKKLRYLTEACEAMRRHITTEYADDLLDYKTVAERKAFIDRILKSANAFLSEGEAMLTMLDTLIKDLDQCGYSLKNVIECLKLLADVKGSRVV